MLYESKKVNIFFLFTYEFIYSKEQKSSCDKIPILWSWLSKEGKKTPKSLSS